MKRKILYIHQYFKTPNEPGGTRSYWFSKELIKEGFAVTMLTSRSNQERKIEIENIEGVNVIYVKNTYNNKLPAFKRLLSFLRFAFLSTQVAYKQKNIDLIFATSTPLTVGIPVLILKWLKGEKFIFEVRDLWPEFPIQIGVLKNKIFQKLAIGFEKSIYRNATHIIALSPGMKEGVTKYVAEDKVTEIPNMSKKDEFYPRNINQHIVNRFDINILEFNIVYFGAMGVANGLDYIIETAKIIQEKRISDINFLFLGDGMTKDYLVNEVDALGLSNVFFLGAQPMDITSEIVNTANCSIVTFLNLPILETNSPNKLFDSLSAGKPIIVNSKGWTKDMVEENNCGIYVDPESPQDLLEKILFLKNNPQVSEEMGKNARRLAETKYDRSILSKRFSNIIKKYV